ncbi:MAG: hypothetical protein JNJ45_08350 [Chthonomonas sp.]|nr:hypothetical protein [Chthonomonas sp.]
MKKNHRSRAAEDTVQAFLDSAGRTVFVLGALGTLISVAMLVYYYFHFAGANDATAAQMQNVALFQKILTPASICLALGSAYQFWGEEILGVVMLIVAGALYAAPSLLAMAGGATQNKVALASANALPIAGVAIGAVAVVAVVIEIMQRVQMRSTLGAKGDTLKYGKGIKEEKETQNVLLGKCWQLPYCRKFVRDLCPIFHAKTTCWKERVGCMCEESVIANAMKGGAIPRDVVAAQKYIPVNSKLTPNQKAERCRNCVIYNERQRHKYKIALPATLVGMGAIYAVFREPLKSGIYNLIQGTQSVADRVLLKDKPGGDNILMAEGFKEVLLVVIFVVAIAYLLKVIEWLFFTLKV